MQQNILGLQISFFLSHTLYIHQRKTVKGMEVKRFLTILMNFSPPTMSATSTVFETGCFGGGETLSKTWIQTTL